MCICIYVSSMPLFKHPLFLLIFVTMPLYRIIFVCVFVVVIVCNTNNFSQFAAIYNVALFVIFFV